MAAKKKNILKRLFEKHTLIVLNEDMQEEQFSFRLNRMNVLVIFCLGAFVIITATVLLLKFTPLQKYIGQDGFQASVEDKEEILNLTSQIEILEENAQANSLYIENLRAITAGEVPMPDIDTTGGKVTAAVDMRRVDLNPSKEDLELRKEVEKEEIFNIGEGQGASEEGNLLFTPLKGIVTSTFSPEERHLAVDIVAQQGEAIKSVAAGTVIFSDWTPDTGYVIIVSHPNSMISVYKHALTTYKKVGDVVKKGEVIAAVGNTGELTTGPHLHFELWADGSPIDPQMFIVF